MSTMKANINEVPFTMIINENYMYLINDELNIKFRGTLKGGIYYKSLPFEFIYEIICYHFIENHVNLFKLELSPNYEEIKLNIVIGHFKCNEHYYRLVLREYFDNFDNKIIAVQGQTDEYEEEIDTDREGVSNSKIYEANDNLKRELLRTKQEFQRLKIANFIYKKSVEKRFDELNKSLKSKEPSNSNENESTQNINAAQIHYNDNDDEDELEEYEMNEAQNDEIQNDEVQDEVQDDEVQDEVQDEDINVQNVEVQNANQNANQSVEVQNANQNANQSANQSAEVQNANQNTNQSANQNAEVQNANQSANQSAEVQNANQSVDFNPQAVNN